MLLFAHPAVCKHCSTRIDISCDKLCLVRRPRPWRLPLLEAPRALRKRISNLFSSQTSRAIGKDHPLPGVSVISGFLRIQGFAEELSPHLNRNLPVEIDPGAVFLRYQSWIMGEIHDWNDVIPSEFRFHSGSEMRRSKRDAPRQPQGGS